MPTGFPDYYGGLTLPVTVPEGGTGLTSITANTLLIGAGSGAMVPTNVGTANQVLQIPSGGGAPQFQSLSISGSAITGIIPIVNGGTGTTTPALVAGTGISLSGSWPNNTITNTSNYAALADPLPVAHGGTGTATPALVAGSNIVITGSWPAQTVALSPTPSITTLDVTPTSGTTAIKLHHNQSTTQAAAIELFDAGNTVTRGYIGAVQGANDFITGAAAGDVFVRADTGDLWLGTGNTYGLVIDQSQVVSLNHPLAVTSGGTGATSLRSAKIPTTDATPSQHGKTGNLGATTIITASGQTLYLIACHIHVHSPTGTSSLSVTISWTFAGVAYSDSALVTLSATTSDKALGRVLFVDADDTTNVQYSTSFTNGGGADSYDLDISAVRV